MLTAAHLALVAALSRTDPTADPHIGEHIAHLACRLATELSLVDPQAVLATLPTAIVEGGADPPHVFAAVCDAIQTFASPDVDKMGFWFIQCLLRLPEAKSSPIPLCALAEPAARFRQPVCERAQEVLVLCEELAKQAEGGAEAGGGSGQWQALLPWLGRSDLRHAACRGLTEFVRSHLDSPASLAVVDPSARSLLYLMLQDMNRPDSDGKHVAAAAASSGNVAVCDTLIVLAERGAAFKYHALPPKHGRHHVDGINRAHAELEELAILSLELQAVSTATSRRATLLTARAALVTRIRHLYTPPAATDKALAVLKQRKISGLMEQVAARLPADMLAQEACPCCAEPILHPLASTDDESVTVMPLVMLPCKHAQHLACTLEWVQGNRATCPTCDVAVDQAWPDIPAPPPVGSRLTGVPVILEMLEACQDDVEVVALCLRQLNDQVRLLACMCCLCRWICFFTPPLAPLTMPGHAAGTDVAPTCHGHCPRQRPGTSGAAPGATSNQRLGSLSRLLLCL